MAIHARNRKPISFFTELLAALLCLMMATTTQAESRVDRAQQLANQALECLRKGEEATHLEARLAAFNEGVELARKAIEVDDENADAHFAMFANEGRLLEHQGVVPNPVTLVRATRELNRTLEIDPNHADALAAKGGMYRQLPWMLGGNKEKAREFLVRSVENDYDNACGARIELAELYRELGEPERSIPLLEVAVEIAKRDEKRDKLTRAQQLLRELTAR